MHRRFHSLIKNKNYFQQVRTKVKQFIHNDNGSSDESREVKEKISTRIKSTSVNNDASVASSQASTSNINLQANPNFFNDIFNVNLLFISLFLVFHLIALITFKNFLHCFT